MDFTPIKLLILDVDGVLTDGGVMVNAAVHGFDDSNREFHVQDGAAIKIWQRAGGMVGILSGRESLVVERRAVDLGISLIRQGQNDKSKAYQSILTEAGLSDSGVAYVGDDLPDLGPMVRCGFPVAVANAVPEIKRRATYVTLRRGGEGAVSEVVEFIMRKQGKWSTAIGSFAP